MVNGHSDSKRGNPLSPLHELFFSISDKGSNIHSFTDRLVHTTTFIAPIVEHWLEREIAQWVDLRSYYTMSRRSTSELHLALE